MQIDLSGTRDLYAKILTKQLYKIQLVYERCRWKLPEDAEVLVRTRGCTSAVGNRYCRVVIFVV